MKGRLAVAAILGMVLSGCRLAGPGADVEAPPTAPAAGLPSKEPMVRIGVVVDTTEIGVAVGSRYEVAVAGGEVLATSETSERWTFRSDASRRITGTSSEGKTIGPVDGIVRIRPLGDGAVAIGNRTYRGTALIRPNGNGKLSAVNVLEMEKYLLGVVPLEIGPRPRDQFEALKVQAIAARTYAIGNMGGRESQGFDFYATVADQVYGGLAPEDTLTSRAVMETAGEIVTYEGRPILAYYSSTCGGQTAGIEEGWPWRPDQPYLKSVSERMPGTDRHYCDASNRFRWTHSWTGSDLTALLKNSLSAYLKRDVPVEPLQNVELVSRTPNGRVDSLRITAAGQSYIVRGDSVRWILPAQAGRILNSAMLFSVQPTIEDGKVTKLDVQGGGWGHGIGMCQFGALGRARAGQNYRQILAAYYKGTEVRRLY